MIKNLHLLLSILFITTAFFEVKSQDSLFVDFPNLQNARVGFHLLDLKTDSTAIAYNSEQLFSPASNTKLFTTALALRNLAPGFCYKTPVTMYGRMKRDGVLAGIINYDFSGDPTLGSIPYKNRKDPAEPMLAMFDSLRVHKFIGGLMGAEVVQYDGTTPSEWLLDDISKPWGVGVHAASFNDNVYWYLDEKRDIQVWDTTEAGDNLKSRVDIHPGYSFMRYLNSSVTRKGISFKKRWPNDKHFNILLSDTIKSVLLDTLIQEINFESRNMWAESLLMEATTHPDSIRRFRPSADSLSRFWREKLNEPRIYFHDGSGMSPYNAVSPKSIASLLRYMTGTAYFESYLNSLPAPGQGTLEDMQISFDDGRTIRMKSGSFTRVRCYSGYVLDKNGTPEYAFSLMVNDFDCTHGEMKEEIGAFLETFFSSEPR